MRLPRRRSPNPSVFLGRRRGGILCRPGLPVKVRLGAVIRLGLPDDVSIQPVHQLVLRGRRSPRRGGGVPCANPTEGGGGGGCASSARCARADNPLAVPDRECRCPSGLMGNGKECRRGDARPRPAVMYDGVTATAETVENGFYCGCTKPIVDACAGFPPCEGEMKMRHASLCRRLRPSSFPSR